ncbi:hypothetical protein SDC9_61482 [bioreactor metagenome]|uniref:DUF4350 domain-containing protein n=1 Tax=bioreactor metagenome TaxID=1076179 RepID=A0A644XFV1_9ZZZZ
MKIQSAFIYILAALLVTLYVVLEAGKSRVFNWKPVYSCNSREPLGCSGLYELLPDLFPGKEFRGTDRDFYTFFNDNRDSGQNLIVITERFDLDESACSKTSDWVGRGNTLFVSASDFSDEFCNKSGFHIDRSPQNEYPLSKPETGVTNQYILMDMDVPVSISGPWNPAIIGLDSASAGDTLMFVHQGMVEYPEPVFLRIEIGAGQIFIHGAPHLFSNYVIHEKSALSLAENTFLRLPEAPVFWDEYYKPGKQEMRDAGMNVIFERESLRTAWQLLIVLMLLYIVFVGKRRQKIIPVIEPPVNTSVEYIRTLGGIYYEKRNNRDILSKRLHFLLMTIRLKFSLDLKPEDPEFIRLLTLATGAQEQDIRKLAGYFHMVKNEMPDSRTTLKISRDIDLFYKKYIY